MKYTLDNGKVVNIPDRELEKNMRLLDLTKEQAIEMWLVDNDLEKDEELEELDAKAKTVKIDHGASADTPRKKSEKPRTVKTSDEKKQLFEYLNKVLLEYCGNSNEKVEILKENKLFSIKINEKIFKLDLIETRKPKTV